jgi:hypothetical protein
MQSIFRNLTSFHSVSIPLQKSYDYFFYQQMKNGSSLQFSPQIQHEITLSPQLKKIYFSKIHSYDLFHPPFPLSKNDQKYILSLFSSLYSYPSFLPRIPFLGYLSQENKRKWYIWSYTPIVKVDSKNDFMELFFEFQYHKNPTFDKYIVDAWLDEIIVKSKK